MDPTRCAFGILDCTKTEWSAKSPSGPHQKHETLPKAILALLKARRKKDLTKSAALFLAVFCPFSVLVRSFCSFGTVICALLVRSGKRGRETCAFGVVMRGYGKVMDLTKTEMTVPKPNKGRKTAKKGGALLVRSFFILCF